MVVIVDYKNIVELLLNGAKFIHVGNNYKEYLDSHIRNSVFLNHQSLKNSRVFENTIRGADSVLPNLPIADNNLVEIIKNLRISMNDDIVVYGNSGENVKNIFYVSHILLSRGFKKVHYLNADWRTLPEELKTVELPVWEIVNETIGCFDDFVHSQELSAYVKINAVNILDVRKVSDFCHAHIPEAVNIDWKHFFVPESEHNGVIIPSNTIKPLDQIIKILLTMKLDSNSSLIVSGEDGNDISPVVFILRRLLNWENVRCHFDSWNVWSYLNKINPISFPITH